MILKVLVQATKMVTVIVIRAILGSEIMLNSVDLRFACRRKIVLEQMMDRVTAIAIQAIYGILNFKFVLKTVHRLKIKIKTVMLVFPRQNVLA